MHNLCVRRVSLCGVWDENYSRTQFLILNTSLIDNGKVSLVSFTLMTNRVVVIVDDHVGKIDNKFHKSAIITSYYPKFVMRNF